MAYEILLPNGAGDETNITSVTGAATHWQAVNDDTGADNTSYVYCEGSSYLRDIYNFQPHVLGTGTIDNVTVYFRILTNDPAKLGVAKCCIKSGASIATGTEVATSYQTVNVWNTWFDTWSLNPATGVAFTWAEIDSLQAGISLKPNSTNPYYEFCTLIYIAVKYHAEIVTSALTRVTALLHYVNQATKSYRLSVVMGGLAPLMLPDLEVGSLTPPPPVGYPAQGGTGTPSGPANGEQGIADFTPGTGYLPPPPTFYQSPPVFTPAPYVPPVTQMGSYPNPANAEEMYVPPTTGGYTAADGESYTPAPGLPGVPGGYTSADAEQMLPPPPPLPPHTPIPSDSESFAPPPSPRTQRFGGHEVFD